MDPVGKHTVEIGAKAAGRFLGSRAGLAQPQRNRQLAAGRNLQHVVDGGFGAETLGIDRGLLPADDDSDGKRL